jgi:hypothetical protein
MIGVDDIVSCAIFATASGSLLNPIFSKKVADPMGSSFDFGRKNGPFFKQRQSPCRSIYKKSREWAVCL